jgi:hypothetical protein
MSRSPRSVHASRSVTLLLGLLFVAGVTVVGVRAAVEVNVEGEPQAARYGLQDFRDAIYFPVRAFLDGRNPYDSAVYTRTYPVGATFPLYSPATLVAYAPFGLLPVRVAEALWFAMSVALLVPVALLAVRLARLERTPLGLLSIMALIVLSRPGHTTLFLGQCTVLMVIGTYLALHFARSRPGIAALGVALTSFKLTFGVPLAVLMLARGERRAAVGGLALGLAIAVPPAAVLIMRAGGLAGMVHLLTLNQQAFAATGQFNPRTTLHRVDTPALVGRLARQSPGPAADLLITLLVLGLGALAVHRLAREGDEEARTTSNLLACLVIVTSVYHQVYDVVLMAFPLAALAAGRSLRGVARWATLALLAIPTVNYLASYAAANVGVSEPWRIALASSNGAALLIALTITVWAAIGRRRDQKFPDVRLSSKRDYVPLRTSTSCSGAG